jgi:hypothetical protein
MTRTKRGFAVVRRGWPLVLVALTVTCGGPTDSGGAGSKFDVVVTPAVSMTTPTNVPLGQSRSFTLTVTRTNYNAPISLSATWPNGQPSGITATFSPTSLTGTTLSSTLTITAAPDAATGQFVLNATLTGGAGAGGAQDYGPVPVFISLQTVGPSINVTRSGSGTGTVVSNPAGINCGNTCTAQFKVLPVTLTETPAANSTFAGWSGGCVSAASSCTFTPTVGGNNNVTATFNSTLPSFSVAIAPASLTVQQGTTQTAAINITRVNGFTGPVNFAVSGAPAGLTVTPNPASASGDAATVSVVAALSVGVGNYPITITATGSGVAQQTLSLGVQVTAGAGGSNNVALSFAACDPAQVPIWFAFQNGNGPWTRVTPGVNNSFTLGVAASTGIAYVTRQGAGFATSVLFVSGAELTAIAGGNICGINPQAGTKRLTGTVQSVVSQNATITIGGADTTFPNPAPPTGGMPFTLTNVPAGARDLIAARSATNANGTTQLQRMIVRRGTNYANAATIPGLDFGGAEGFSPVAHNSTLSNLAGDQSSISESLITSNGASGDFHESPGAFAPVAGVDFVPYVTIPDALLLAGDFHEIFIGAASGANATSFRFISRLLHTTSANVDTLTFGPRLSTPSVTSLGTTPYLRLRARLPLQSEYNAAASAQFSQADNSADVSVTAAYLGAAPGTWTIDVPDLTSAGYDATWGIRAGLGVSWGVNAIGGNFLPFVGGSPVDAIITGAGAFSGSPATFARLVRSRRGALRP